MPIKVMNSPDRFKAVNSSPWTIAPNAMVKTSFRIPATDRVMTLVRLMSPNSLAVIRNARIPGKMRIGMDRIPFCDHNSAFRKFIGPSNIIAKIINAANMIGAK